jgi:hypothetical protein
MSEESTRQGQRIFLKHFIYFYGDRYLNRRPTKMEILAIDYSSEISGIMEAVHAHLNFKLIALIIALSTVMKNVPHHQVIPVEMYSPSFKRIKGKLHYTKRVG